MMFSFGLNEKVRARFEAQAKVQLSIEEADRVTDRMSLSKTIHGLLATFLIMETVIVGGMFGHEQIGFTLHLYSGWWLAGVLEIVASSQTEKMKQIAKMTGACLVGRIVG